MTAAEGLVADLTLGRPARLGATRLVCIDGPAGSGKTTFAEGLVLELTNRGLTTALVHLDDLYEGWQGLGDVGPRLLEWVVTPLAEGRPAEHPVYDWHLGRYRGSRTVPVTDVIVVEGVGSGHPGVAERLSLLVWVDAPADLRLARGLARDGSQLEAEWRRWTADERRLLAAERTEERADVVVDGVSGEVKAH